MTSAEHNNLMPTQKLEWVTPKISLMDAVDTDGNKVPRATEGVFPIFYNGGWGYASFGS